ncbi:SDR family NAD(P)-dependent oxidoreductase [Microbacterium sp.]|uniref:SDR family NAD(P)-dependent oxidoreductase n=1 Tax=Microbacterium sp. TaxID=51671 RepID=UPI003C7264DD
MTGITGLSEDFGGRVAVVTGGLSGIGKAIAHRLAAGGAHVDILDVQDEKAAAVINECRRLGGEATYRRCDLFDASAVFETFAAIEAAHGRLDYAVNNAGFGILAKPFGEVSAREIDQLLGINVRAHMLCMVEELRIMRRGKFGRIVNTASGAGLVAGKGMALYSACKHAIVGLTKAAALDYARDNITINAIAPGTVETELVSAIKETSPDDYAAWAASNPIGRLAQPDEMARVVAFLCLQDSAFINGTVIPVDSGYVAGK